MKMPKVKIDKEVSNFATRNILWGVMVLVLAMLYIHNGFVYERLMLETHDREVELKEREYEYTVVQKQLNSIGVRSNVRQRLQQAGSEVKDSRHPNRWIE